MKVSGNLVCVSLGMLLGAHISPICRSHIEQADVVFLGASDSIFEKWVKQMHPDVRSLQVYYQEGKSRLITYNEMVDAMLTEVRAGKKVVGAFYGHAGVFAYAPHKAIALAKAEGYNAYMEPGISAEDCLFADLAIDPGKYGCQQYEASQFMFYQRVVDTAAYLILWQISIAGDTTLGDFHSNQQRLALLVELLMKDYGYPADHQVILYQARVLPIEQTLIKPIPLAELASTELNQHMTLVLPPCKKMVKNSQILDKLNDLNDINNN